MAKQLILSIKPRFLDLILTGLKTVELRKASTKIEPGTTILLYATSPRCEIVGSAQVDFRALLSKEDIWMKYSRMAGVTRIDFESYYADAPTGVVLGLRSVARFLIPVHLDDIREVDGRFRPPQSYMRAPQFVGAMVNNRLSSNVRPSRNIDISTPSSRAS